MKDTCPVCLDEDTRLCKPYGCLHGLCATCYKTWTKDTCPICRRVQVLKSKRASNDWIERSRQLNIKTFAFPLYDDIHISITVVDGRTFLYLMKLDSSYTVTKCSMVCCQKHHQMFLKWLRRHRVCSRAWTTWGHLKNRKTFKQIPLSIREVVQRLLS